MFTVIYYLKTYKLVIMTTVNIFFYFLKITYFRVGSLLYYTSHYYYYYYVFIWDS